ncbi:MAG: serine protease Do [Polaribacter sp.]|jgi:serine protease Do
MLKHPYQSTIVQIATPYLIGTGFCLNEDGIIVTNEHIVRDSRRVVVDHPIQGKQLGEVIYLDAKRDLALLRVAKKYNVPTIKIQQGKSLLPGTEVYALGAMEIAEESFKKGAVLVTDVDIDEVLYISHTAILNGSDSGGPLLDVNGFLLGVNTFIMKGGEMRGLSLPVSFLKEALAQLEPGTRRTSARCYNCGTISYDDNPLGETCPGCKEELQLPGLIPPYKPFGVAATIEALLAETVDEVALTRRGPNCWQVQQGSAIINISYYEKNGLIVGDAHLCVLPVEDNEALFIYLLKQNYKIENLSFSIRNGDIVLSLMIYDRYLNERTGYRLFQYLFQQADGFDNILVEQYGALWKEV